MESNIGRSGGSIIKNNLFKNVPRELLNKFQFVVDYAHHFEKLDDNKIRIYWSHLEPNQNEEVCRIIESNSIPLSNGGWSNYHKIIFISHHQMEEWIKKYNIPRSHCMVIKYALNPIDIQNKPEDKIVLFHQCSPQRGLSLLVDVFEKLCEEYNNLELKVHSSWEIYNEKDNNFLKIFRDKQKEYENSDLYHRLEKHPKIHNIGYLPNNELRKSLSSSHIFSYPNIMVETFCLSLLEAMSAGLLCVHPNYGCLPETASNWTMMYPYHENIIQHKKIFYCELKKAIEIVNTKQTQEHLKKQKEYVDYLFNWERRTKEWINLLESLENLPLKKVKKISSIIY